MYSGNVSPCIEINLTRDFKGKKTPLHIIIYTTSYEAQAKLTSAVVVLPDVVPATVFNV